MAANQNFQNRPLAKLDITPVNIIAKFQPILIRTQSLRKTTKSVSQKALFLYFFTELSSVSIKWVVGQFCGAFWFTQPMNKHA